MKNFEKIQSMSIEELAEIIEPCCIDTSFDSGDCNKKSCVMCSAEWLRQEVRNED